MNSTKDFNSAALPTAIRNGRVYKRSCQTEVECWGVFVKVCSLSKDDCSKILSLGYSSMKTLSMFGLHNDAQSLLAAGLEDAKAHMVLLFAAFVLHSIHHKLKIPKGLTFDHVLDFSFHVSAMNSSDKTLSNRAKLLDISTECADDTQRKRSRRSRPWRRSRSRESSGSQQKTVRWTDASKDKRSSEMDSSLEISTTSTASTLAVSQYSLASGISRWSSCVEKPSGCVTKRDSGSSSGSGSTRMVCRPLRRPSINERDAEHCCSDHAAAAATSKPVELNQWNGCTTYVAPKTPSERACLRWAVALDVDEDLTDSDYSDSDYSDSDDWEASDASHSDGEEELKEEKDSKSNSSNSGSGQTISWKKQNVLPHEWSLPANKVLPVNLQSLFHAAARDPEFDISESIHSALVGPKGQAKAA